MQYKSVTSVAEPQSYDCLVFAVLGNKLGRCAWKISPALANELEGLMMKSNLNTENTACEIFHCVSLKSKPMVIVVKFNSVDQSTIKTMEKQLTDVIRCAHKSGRKSLLLCWSDLKLHSNNDRQYYQLLTQFCEMTEYSGIEGIKEKASHKTLESIVFFDSGLKQKKTVKKFIHTGKAIARGINFSKSLSDLPANTCTPSFLAKQAVKLSKDSIIETNVIDEEKMEKLNMGCVLAVSKGSNQPARLIVMNYQGAKADSPPVVLIGKGVTFDSGGYSIKSAPGMHEMKFDMCGAASVMGVLLAISSLKTAVNVVGILPCSENLIDGQAFKPGDILTSMSGKTVEILSTDAEGRLLLADALTYSQRFKPSLVIDVATLTGAAITALGHDISALMSNNKKLSRHIYKAGQAIQDHVWPLPVWEEYSEVLNSNFADLASSAGRDGNSGAGAIVAACFLSKFTDKFRWAHIDVAGTAWYRGKHLRASGRPVALLSQFLINYSNKPF